MWQVVCGPWAPLFSPLNWQHPSISLVNVKEQLGAMTSHSAELPKIKICDWFTETSGFQLVAVVQICNNSKPRFVQHRWRRCRQFHCGWTHAPGIRLESWRVFITFSPATSSFLWIKERRMKSIEILWSTGPRIITMDTFLWDEASNTWRRCNMIIVGTGQNNAVLCWTLCSSSSRTKRFEKPLETPRRGGAAPETLLVT